MKQFDGNAFSWALADGVVEVALHRPPANELSMASWAELEQFVEALKSLESRPDPASTDCVRGMASNEGRVLSARLADRRRTGKQVQGADSGMGSTACSVRPCA